MKQLKHNFLLIVLALSAVLTACHKNNDTAPAVVYPINKGLFVVNQGNYNSNNSTMSYYDNASQTVTADIFSSINGAKLGDTGNDVEIYGSKTYIVVNVSSTVEVINTRTGKSIKQLSFKTATGAPSQTRWITFYKGNAFVTSYDNKVSVIDTASLTVTKPIAVGANPEQMAIANGKLYVANSGGLQATFSNTVSVIDLSTLAVIKTINVGTNPLSVAASSYGDVYVTAQGDYGNILPSLTIINSTTDVAAAPVNTDIAYGSPFVISGDIAYYFGGDNKVKTYNVKTKTAASASFVTDATTFTAPYALTVDDATGEVFVGDAKNYVTNGSVTALDKTGKKEYAFTVGLIPGKIAIVK